MKQNQIISLVLVAVIFGAGGFFGGMKYQQSKAPNFNFGDRAGMVGQFGNRQGGGMGQNGTQARRMGGQTYGDILSLDDKTMTVKMADGSSKIILLSDSTSFNKEATGTKTDLKVGDKVGVFGQSNTDGSISAQMVQINPVMRQQSLVPTK
ncbi:hypothetical protein KBC75_00275 [Candidatus Shapirobacteria bacterium]|nr:hypothetical protein [Candidatus Shapirobacteria bacterium]